jgi:tripartite-type tricarboxylate transporter receptor subunit TctC
LNDAGVRNQLLIDGAEAQPSKTPDEFALFVQAEIKKWAQVVKAAGISQQ